jgi:hypothetical protein
MRGLTDSQLDILVRCPKVINDPPRREMRVERGTLRNDMRLVSEDGEHEFSAFMRVNEDFPENFSIGLSYVPKDGTGAVCLLRCNGPHGNFVGEGSNTQSHFLYHIHVATEANLDAGLRGHRGARRTDSYASFRGALLFFLEHTGVREAANFFPGLLQLELQFADQQTGEEEENELH